ncbi:hypothetical protein [Streptomyces canus]|uniref:deoxynucleotide monophosphate kinase family protein n=1 Tax=Streptomyces canus TaxID=58343 RepID=UPI00386E99B4|nr:hypothetical protein OH824_34785 [Streptomyces canus]
MNIGIIGRARVGKDTAGKWLVDGRGYRRIGFADALKAAALKVDPIVGVDDEGAAFHLSEVIRLLGWEEAKEAAEVRRFLQELGSAMRTVDPEIWIRPVLAEAIEANDASVPVVVTDVRYPNEVESLRRAGFYLLYINRPGVPQLDHESENSLGPEDADYHIFNGGSLDKLRSDVEGVWERVHALESARMALRF